MTGNQRIQRSDLRGRAWRFLVGLLVVSLVAAACTSPASDTTTTTTTVEVTTTSQGDTTTTTAESEEPDATGGILVVAVPVDPSTLDPRQNHTNDDRNVTINVYNSLVEFDLDDFSLKPGLAKSWDIADDGLTITLELEEGVLFHDGSDMTSADVKWTIEENQGIDRTANGLANVTEVVAVDDYTIELRLSAPDALVLETLIDVYVRPEGWEFDPDNLIGTGPFKFVEWNRNEVVILERNEDYWRAGLPKLDGIRLETVPDQSARYLRLETGTAHLLSQAPFTVIEQAQDAGFPVVLPTGGAGGVYDIRFNVREEPWSDKRVRQALAYAIDREAAANVLLGMYAPISNPVTAGSPFLSPDAPTYELDVDRAKELLAEAGYPDGLDAGGFMTHFDLGFDFEVLAQLIQQNAAAVGIQLEIDNVDVNTWVDRYLNEGWGAGLSVGAMRPTPFDAINHTWGKARPEAQGHDETLPEFIDALALARTLNPESDEYRDALWLAQEIAMEDLPSIVVGTRPTPNILDPSVIDFKAHPNAFLIFESVSLGG